MDSTIVVSGPRTVDGLPLTPYCQSKGYKEAATFKWAKDNQKTRIINGGQVCDAAFCDRISTVTCKESTVTFDNPQVGGYGLDFCREWAKDCGWPAAHAFCLSKGHPKATDFKWAKDNQKTRIISGGQVCDAPFCDCDVIINSSAPVRSMNERNAACTSLGEPIAEHDSTSSEQRALVRADAFQVALERRRKLHGASAAQVDERLLP